MARPCATLCFCWAVFLTPYANVAIRTRVVGVDMFSRGGAVLFAAMMGATVLWCAKETWWVYEHRKLSGREDFFVCFAALSLGTIAVVPALKTRRSTISSKERTYAPQRGARKLRGASGQHERASIAQLPRG